MKVLIVDDEEHVRQGIDLTIDWVKYDVHERYYAENGEMALTLIRLHNPAVLFCDMSMPGMDGTELLSIVRDEYPYMQIIVLSGYNDYVYTRATIRASGVDYIMKPFKKRDLEHALEQAITAWKQHESSLKVERDTGYRLQQADMLLDEQKLGLFLKGELSFYPSIVKLFSRIGLPLQHIRVSIILPQNKIQLIEQRYHGDAELFDFAVKNITNELLQEYGPHYLYRLDDHQWILLTVVEEAYRPDKQAMLAGKVLNAWKETIGIVALSGSSEVETDIEHLQAHITIARAALLQCYITSDQIQPNNKKAKPSFVNQEMLLHVALKNGDRAYAAEIIRSFTHTLQQYGPLQLKDLQMLSMEVNYMLERAVRQLSLGVAECSISLWISNIAEWEKTVTQQWWRLIEESGADGLGNGSIHAIRDYIQRHFQSQLSLATLSHQFHFSPQYIAKKFKELYNTTVMTYQTELRIEKAKSLLEHTDLTVSEISEIIGYADENYFTKVFRKQLGLPPLKYRRHIRDS